MRGHQDFTAASSRLHGDGWALVGDAAVFIDPVFSSGVLLGLESAHGLAACVLGHDTHDRWEARVRRASGAFEHAALAWYDASFLTVLFSAAERQDERTRGEIVALLAGDVFDDASTGPVRAAARLTALARHLGRSAS